MELNKNIDGSIDVFDRQAQEVEEKRQQTYQVLERLSQTAAETNLMVIASKEQYEIEKQERQLVEEKKADIVFKPSVTLSTTDTFYDVEIRCDSILQLTAGDGWAVKVTSVEYQEKRKKNMIVTAFYGLYNKGKSFLASKLSKKTLPLGYSVSTVGLSALYPKDLQNENAVVFLDTAGTETPICYLKRDDQIERRISQLYEKEEIKMRKNEFSNKIYEIKLRDRLLTEHFLQRFILHHSNLVLLVVDQLTKEEQRLIQKIKNMYQDKEIIIVHNFSKLVCDKDVNKYVDSDITGSFEVQRQFRKFPEVSLEGIFYVEQRKNYSNNTKRYPDITHVIMAHEHSDVGKHYNPFCYYYIQSRIQALTNDTPFDIVQQLSNMIRQNLPDIVDIPDNIKEIEVNYNEVDSRIVTNVQSIGLKSISFDLLGDLKVFKGGIDPKYSIIMNQKENILILQVEICGPFHATQKDQETSKQNILTCSKTNFTIYEWHGQLLSLSLGFRKHMNDMNEKFQHINLRGHKEDVLIQKNYGNKEQKQTKEKIQLNDREKGEFRVSIPMSTSQCVLSDEKPDFLVKDGIIQFTYVLQSNCEDIDFY